MKACVLVGERTTEIVERPIPEINDDEVLVKILICGVCSAELSAWKAGFAMMNGVQGHEPVGIIEKAGRNVQGFAVGDRITGFSLGSFAQYTKINCKFLAKVPASLADIEAIGEPMSCMYSAAEWTPVSLGDTVAIVGLGFMGLGMLQLMKMKGAGKIIAIGNKPESLANARRFGADITWLPDEVEDRYLVASGWDLFGKGVPVVIEAAGSQSALSLAGDMAAVFGKLVVVGFHQQPRTLNIEMWNKKAITMINAHERRKDLQTGYMVKMMDMIAQGKFNAKDMVTHAFTPHEIDKAFAALESKPAGFIKGYVDFRNF
jgi:threonine dehydrogenase-like Zn-dependent dehydrogenase